MHRKTTRSSIRFIDIDVHTAVRRRGRLASHRQPGSGARVAARALHKYVELAWAFSTIIGIVLFMFELRITCWIKFAHVYGGNVVLEHVNGTLSDDESSASNRWIAALVASVVLGVFVLVFLVFAARFYYFIVLHRYEVSTKAMSELQALKENLDVTSDSNVVNDANRRDFVAVDLHSDRSSYHEAIDNL